MRTSSDSAAAPGRCSARCRCRIRSARETRRGAVAAAPLDNASLAGFVGDSVAQDTAMCDFSLPYAHKAGGMCRLSGGPCLGCRGLSGRSRGRIAGCRLFRGGDGS